MSKTILFSDLIAIGLGNYMRNPVINDMQNVACCANSNDTHNFSKNAYPIDSDS